MTSFMQLVTPTKGGFGTSIINSTTESAFVYPSPRASVARSLLKWDSHMTIKSTPRTASLVTRPRSSAVRSHVVSHSNLAANLTKAMHIVFGKRDGKVGEGVKEGSATRLSIFNGKEDTLRDGHPTVLRSTKWMGVEVS